MKTKKIYLVEIDPWNEEFIAFEDQQECIDYCKDNNYGWYTIILHCKNEQDIIADENR